jgi:hypothetical protein
MSRAGFPLPRSSKQGRARSAGTHRTSRRTILELGIVVAISLVLGGLTSPAQMLPLGIGALANSASGYTLLTAGTIWIVGERRTVPAAVQGIGSFLALLAGYQIVSTLRGYPDSEELFTVIAIIVGPFVGLAAAWLHAHGTRAAIGVTILAGIGLGDSSNGFLRVLATTGWLYWACIGIAALVLLVLVTKTRTSSLQDRAIAIAGTVLLAGAFLTAFTVLS